MGGIVLYGLYPVVANNSNGPNIIATDVLGNPLPALYSTISGVAITSVAYTAGSPNTLTVHFTGPYTVLPGEAVNIFANDGSISGTYIVISSTSTSYTVPTTLGGYTFATTASWNNTGTTPIFNTVSGSGVVTVTFPDHGQPVGAEIAVLNPTIVGGLTLQGTYTVESVPHPYSFTINANALATATSYQWQGAIPVTGGSATGTSITLDYSTSIFNFYLGIGSGFGGVTIPFIYTQGINPSGWNGNFTVTGFANGQITYASTATAGSWVSGGSFAQPGGLAVFIYFLTAPIGNIGNEFGNPINGGFWTLDNWGNDLIAVSGKTTAITYPTFKAPYQPIYFWDPTGSTIAQAITAGPTASNGAFVAMPERQIVAWGLTFNGIIDPLLIRWTDVNNFNVWVAQTTNQAGSFRLPSGAAIIGARQVNQQGLIWTDIELWSMQYISLPDVYGFNKIGIGCGLIGKYAHMEVLGRRRLLMSKTQIWMLSSGGAVAIPCPIWDVAFQDLDLVNAGKITCATNAMFQEISWYFPVKSGTGENSQYIKLNVSGLIAGQPPLWDYGTLDRSAWIDVSVLQQPIGFSPANHLIYQHEISPDADGAAMGESFETGWFSVADGDVMPFIDQIWPDFKWGYFAQAQSANINFTISGADYPGLSVQTVGPYTVTQATTWISPRMRHRLMSFTVSGTGTGTWWRLGGLRYRWQPDGKF